MATGDLTGTTMTAEDIFQKLTTTGVSKYEAQMVVANWILGNAGVLPRTFAYQTPFEGAEAACAPQFTRSFAHQDWVDGEDVVQAEQTTGEDGFNTRFHRIESDLDALGSDVAQAFVCINAMRASLRLLLDELQAELNLVYRQIASTGGGGGFPVPVEPGGGGVFTGGGGVWTTGGVFTGGGPAVTGGTYLGTTKFFDHDVHVFQTSAGRVVLPAVEGVTVTPFENPRVQRAKALGEFLVSPKVQEAFAQGPIPKRAFVERFGDEVLSNGEGLRDAMEIIPDDTLCQSPLSVLEGLATREGAAIRTSGLERESIEVTFGLAGDARVADAPLDRLEVVPRDARTALVGEGVSTIGEFVSADPGKLAAILRGRGVDVKTADVGGWLGAAKTLVSVR